jgi:phenolic acid decarboxylase
MTNQATTAQVRQSYRDQGYEVRITNTGHVSYRGHGHGGWLEGRWVSEYRLDGNGEAYLQ